MVEVAVAAACSCRVVNTATVAMMSKPFRKMAFVVGVYVHVHKPPEGRGREDALASSQLVIRNTHEHSHRGFQPTTHTHIDVSEM